MKIQIDNVIDQLFKELFFFNVVKTLSNTHRACAGWSIVVTEYGEFDALDW
jgi:hypothetical protein